MSFVRTIVDLAHNLGLAAVAEGVETPAQVAVLRELGCDKVQGYHFGRPAGATATTAVLATAAADRDQTTRRVTTHTFG